MGSGGMRFGAGRPAIHVKAEHCKQIDVRRWQREGMLTPGQMGSWLWTNKETGERLASIGYRAGEGFVSLDYSIDGKPSGQTVQLKLTRCNYGGMRPWFVCPIRGERVAELFLRAGRFACRHCQSIAYASQSADALDRGWRKQAKIEARLDADWQRPKGMHRTTHAGLLSMVMAIEERRDLALSAYLARLWAIHPSFGGGPQVLTA